jgi:hypothetical protein
MQDGPDTEGQAHHLPQPRQCGQLFEFVATATDNRLQALVDAVTTGVEVEVDYYDDLTQ